MFSRLVFGKHPICKVFRKVVEAAQDIMFTPQNVKKIYPRECLFEPFSNEPVWPEEDVQSMPEVRYPAPK